MSKGAGWVIQTMLLALLQLRYPASVMEESPPEPEWGRDPAYAVYERYRYAYETYGYLFLSDDSSRGEKEEAGEPGKKEGEHGTQADQVWGRTESWEQEEDGPAASVYLAQLQDYDFLMSRYYSVHASTTAPRELMRADLLLGTDLKLEQTPDVPQILIYHTHSQETYADYGPEHMEATVVENGRYLAELLRMRGWNVIHDTSEYDIQGGKLDRNKAYNYALEGITKILEEHPSIEVVLDLHRDGVPEQTRLVAQVNGKPTAKLMFFQGMSRTPEGEISYLPNPYLKENLAFGFQLQMEAERFSGATRKIYLKGLRYNLHLRGRSALVEVGAQNNTLQEAKNAMEVLAEVLDRVLQGK